MAHIDAKFDRDGLLYFTVGRELKAGIRIPGCGNSEVCFKMY